MARVTVEDCSEVVPSRFELVVLAAQRSRSIGSGAPLNIDRDNDKDPVVALREIAGKKVSVDKLREIIIQNSQEKVNTDEYGVEEVREIKGEDPMSDEITEEISTLQMDVGAESDDELLYGGDDVALED